VKGDESGTELRSFVYLDDTGGCYLKTEKGGGPAGNWGVELGKMEACPARLDASLAHPTDEEFIVRKLNVLQARGISRLTIEGQPDEIDSH